MKPYVTILVILLLASTSFVGISYKVEKSSTISFDGNTLYVGGSGPNNYTSIQDAIDNASDGDTVFVYDDSSPYLENVVIDKSINLMGEDKNSTIIDGSDNDVVIVHYESIKIRGFTIQNGDTGTHIMGKDTTVYDNIFTSCHVGIINEGINNNISNNNIKECTYGVRVLRANNTLVLSNIFVSRGYESIRIYNGCNNIISNNSIDMKNYWGLLIDGKSENNIIYNNHFFHNGIYLATTHHNNIYNNTVNEKPLVYLENKSNINIDNAGQVILLRCDNISVMNQSLSDTVIGIELIYTRNCTISGNTISQNNFHGIYLLNAFDNVIKDNTIKGAFLTETGIYILNACGDNTISNNSIIGDGNGIECTKISSDGNCYNNTISGNYISTTKAGIHFFGASYNNISYNTLVGCGIGFQICWNNNIYRNNVLEGSGIGLTGSKDNNVCSNIISSNQEGIEIYASSSNNLISGNIFDNNDYCIKITYSSGNNLISNNEFIGNGYGIFLEQGCILNKICYNNFINNQRNAYFKFFSSNNIWRGNYWDRPRTLPKPIIGQIGLFLPIPWVNFDWHPAQVPYDI